jgi:type I restriction enzyme M protein
VTKELTEAEISEIGNLYHGWRGEKNAGKYQDKAGFCRAVKIEEIEKNNWILSPGRYVGAEDVLDDGISFEDKINILSSELMTKFSEGKILQSKVEDILNGIRR